MRPHDQSAYEDLTLLDEVPEFNFFKSPKAPINLTWP
jgi:hypothetical protein